jgi:hypothetical protein
LRLGALHYFQLNGADCEPVANVQRRLVEQVAVKSRILRVAFRDSSPAVLP